MELDPDSTRICNIHNMGHNRIFDSRDNDSYGTVPQIVIVL
jgi:hypothetical protein